MKKCAEYPLLYLLMIPGVLILDVILYLLAAWIDASHLPSGSGMGHPVAIATILVTIIIAILTTVVVVLSIVLTITRFVRKKRLAKQEKTPHNTTGTKSSCQNTSVEE